MQYTSTSPFWNNTMLDFMEDALFNPPALQPANAGLIKLYSAGPTAPGQHPNPADFTENAFAGYAASVIVTPSGPVNVPGGNGRALAWPAMFVAGAVVSPGETALGYYVTNAGGTAVLMWESFPVPFNFVSNGDFLALDVLFGLPNLGSL